MRLARGNDRESSRAAAAASGVPRTSRTTRVNNKRKSFRLPPETPRPVQVESGDNRALVRGAAVTVATVALLLLLQNALIAAYLPRVERLASDFSPQFLQHKLSAMAAAPPEVVFLGDSALWGYALHTGDTAVAILNGSGCRCVNLAFKAGSPANDYALVRLLLDAGVRPRLIVLEINQRAFNPDDSSYKNLYPAIAALADPSLSAQDRVRFGIVAQPPTPAAKLDAFLSSAWLVYGMRADLRALLTGDVDPLPAKPLTIDDYLGTYDLAPLDEQNLSVVYLEKLLDLLRSRRIPVLAYLTPTNHRLLHDLIDVPAYRANGAYLERIVARYGGRVVDLDAAFPSSEFFDSSHLTKAGQQHLAAVLSRAIAQESPL